MRSRYFIYLLMFLCLMVGARADALSLEAQKAIEDMRARLNSSPAKEDIKAEPVYIPGQELAAALARLKNKIHGIETESFVVVDNSVAAPVVPADSSDYPVGKQLASALMKIRESQGRSESLRVVMSILEERNDDKGIIIEDPVSEIFKQPTKNEKVESRPEVKPRFKPAKKLKKSVAKVVKSKPVKKPARESTVVKKAEPAPARADKKVASEKTSEKLSESKTKTVVKSDDKDFNETIKKYDFKMPENYRIIVR